MFQFVHTHIISCVTLTHSDVVVNEVVAEDLQLVHSNYHANHVENSRIAPNYQPLLGPFCTYNFFISICMFSF
jgi:hypothetical protein